ncbi:MAG TPA: ABC transporter substrate-binding protein [Ruminiclostridium sp.]
MNTASIIATMTAISKTSKDPNRCIMLYNLLYDDKDTKLFNMMNYGIEGKHYTLKDDVATFVANSGYMLASGWENGNMFNSYRQSDVQPKWYPVGPDMNNSATVSKLLGFNLNPEPIKNELAQIASVVDEYYGGLFTGVADPDVALPKFLEKLKGAGADTIVAETQTQIDAWKKTK